MFRLSSRKYSLYNLNSSYIQLKELGKFENKIYLRQNIINNNNKYYDENKGINHCRIIYSIIL